ncbi:MAG: hypothetical protein HZA14_03950 [Nitrospirae bacterium]|nr:hypothetical protein [Nitrospirota bacterium]
MPEITEDIIYDLASGVSVSKGYDYFHTGAVLKVWIENGAYKAHVEGSELYTVTISGKKGDIQMDCTCPYDWGGACKHVIAAILAVCNNKNVKRHKKDITDIKALIEKVDAQRLKRFLFDVLSGNAALLEDFKIFARGKEEMTDTSEKYKKEILSQFKKLKGIEHYYDHYRDSYEHPVSDILNGYVEPAEKYAAQENYKEAIKIYQGICDACMESLRNDRLEDFYDDIHFAAGESFNAIAENVRKHFRVLIDKKPYLDYMLRAYGDFEDKEIFRDVFMKMINHPEEADYALNKQDVDLIPPIKLNLLIVKNEPDAVFSFGERYYMERPEMAVPLSAYYLKNKQRDKAVAVAEKAVEIIQGNRRDFYFSSRFSDPLKELREFLHTCYKPESDYQKIVENLIMLITQENDIAYYDNLRKIIKTEDEKGKSIERLEKLLHGNHDMLFKIYSIEDDYGKMLELARESIRFDVFDQIVKKIRDRYPDECIELYKKKINKFLEEVKSREAYRQVAYWLKLMKDIPGSQDKFLKHVEHLREKYRRRPAFIDEIKRL